MSLLENISTKTYNEKLKEKLALKREKRLLEEKLASVKTLGDESDSDEDVSKWVEKNRKIVNEKEQAEKKVSILIFFQYKIFCVVKVPKLSLQ